MMNSIPPDSESEAADEMMRGFLSRSHWTKRTEFAGKIQCEPIVHHALAFKPKLDGFVRNDQLFICFDLSNVTAITISNEHGNTGWFCDEHTSRVVKKAIEGTRGSWWCVNTRFLVALGFQHE